MSTDKIGIALVGSGYIAQAEHVPALRLLDTVEIKAVVDIRAETAIKVARLCGANYYTDLRECLDKEEVGAVDICTPYPTHEAICRIAAQAKKHIFVEKPLASDSKEAKEIVRVAQENNVRLQVGYMRRFDTDCIKIKKLIEKGELGDIKVVSSIYKQFFKPSYVHLGPAEEPNYGMRPVLSRFKSASIHQFNLLRFWLGELEEIMFAQKNDRIIHVVMRFQNDVMVTHTYLDELGHGEELWLFGTKNNVHTKLWSPHFPYEFADTIIFNPEKRQREQLLLPRQNPFVAEIKHFVDCILLGKVSISSGKDSIRDLEIIEEICSMIK